MKKHEVTAPQCQLSSYVEEILRRCRARTNGAKGILYVQGLLLDGRQKSIQPMAERLGVDHQQLQQFTASSTCAVETVRRHIARCATDLTQPQAWVIDDTEFPKDGLASPGVARQYSGTLGKAARSRCPCIWPPIRCHRRSTGGCICQRPGRYLGGN